MNAAIVLTLASLDLRLKKNRGTIEVDNSIDMEED
jgi:hypothetical protein